MYSGIQTFKYLYSFDLAEKLGLESCMSNRILDWFSNYNYIYISFSLKSITKKSKRAFISGSFFLENWSGGRISKIRIIRLKKKSNKPIRFTVLLKLRKNVNWSHAIKNMIYKNRKKRHLIRSKLWDKLDTEFDFTTGRYACNVSFRKVLHAVDCVSKELPFYRFFEEQTYHYTIYFWRSTNPLLDNLFLSYHKFPTI